MILKDIKGRLTLERLLAISNREDTYIKLKWIYGKKESMDQQFFELCREYKNSLTPNV